MSEAKENTLSMNVRLKPSESSAHPRAANYTNVGVAQGIVYVDFGFIEPSLLGAIAKTAKDGQAAPKGLDGALITRVAMGVDVLARLHQQIQQVLIVCVMRGSRSRRGKYKRDDEWKMFNLTLTPVSSKALSKGARHE